MSNSTQMSALDRIHAILDDNSFVEIGAQVTARATNFNLPEKAAPSDGVITGYGTINGGLVYIYSQDASVLNGSVGEMHARKIVRIYDLAMKMGAPVIGLLDSTGLRLQEGTDALNAFSAIYEKENLASGVIPQICAVYGKCGGGLAVLAAMADFTFMADGAKLFVNSPNALAGNFEDKLDTASAKFQAESGAVDFTGDEEAVAAGVRQLVSMLPANNDAEADYADSQDDLNRACPDMAAEAADPVLALTDIADSGLFVEVKSAYAKEMVTGFLKINGATVGAVANRTAIFGDDGKEAEKFAPVLTVDGAEKAADFVNFCDSFEIPVLTLSAVEGFDASIASEKKIAKAAAKLAFAFANASVPKVNVVTGKSFGTAYTVMNSQSLGADMTYAWDDAQIGMMDASAAAKIIYADAIDSAKDVQAEISEKASEYAKLQSGVEQAAARGFVDAVIAPEDTRKYVAAAFEMLYSKAEDRPVKKHGTV